MSEYAISFCRGLVSVVSCARVRGFVFDCASLAFFDVMIGYGLALVQSKDCESRCSSTLFCCIIWKAKIVLNLSRGYSQEAMDAIYVRVWAWARVCMYLLPVPEEAEAFVHSFRPVGPLLSVRSGRACDTIALQIHARMILVCMCRVYVCMCVAVKVVDLSLVVQSNDWWPSQATQDFGCVNLSTTDARIFQSFYCEGPW